MRKCLEYQQEIWNLKAEKELLYESGSNSNRFDLVCNSRIFNLDGADYHGGSTDLVSTLEIGGQSGDLEDIRRGRKRAAYQTWHTIAERSDQ